MSIQHELSNDIAVALLTGEKKDPEELDDLKEVVLRIHAALQELETKSRPRRSSHARSERISSNKDS